MTNTKDKGTMAELEVMCFLKRHGYHLSVPFGENAPYDLIAESPTGILYRVQTRSSIWHRGVINLSLRAVSKNYSRSLDRNRIDVFALWDGSIVHIIPVCDTLACKSVFSLRRDAPVNGQTRNINPSIKYQEAIALMP